MDIETKNWFLRRKQFVEQAISIIEKHAPMLNKQQAREVAIIAIKAWQDMRSIYSFSEADEFIESF